MHWVRLESGAYVNLARIITAASVPLDDWDRDRHGRTAKVISTIDGGTSIDFPGFMYFYDHDADELIGALDEVLS